jgi:hypothetical protein
MNTEMETSEERNRLIINMLTGSRRAGDKKEHTRDTLDDLWINFRGRIYA